jgi:hypothetical protein
MARRDPPCCPTSQTASSPVDQTSLANGGEKSDPGLAGKNRAVDIEPSYTPPSPRQYFAHFVDHHEHFIKFLELVAATLWSQTIAQSMPTRSISKPLRPTELTDTDDPVVNDQRAVWNTLLELYLASAKSGDADGTAPARGKVKNLMILFMR